MTIDINELREAIQTFGSQAIDEGDLNEILDRLEAAEKDVAIKEEVIDSLAAVVKRLDAQRDSAEKERDDLLEVLKNIEEYWNQDQNETAMADACWHAINTARAAIIRVQGEKK